MIKRITTIVLGIVVLLLAVQPKLLVHFCGDHFIALYLNQDPAAVKSACGGRVNKQLANNQLSSERLTNPRIADGELERYSQQEAYSLETNVCPQRQLTVVDVAVDEFIAAPPSTYNFSFEWQAVTLFLPMVAHYLLPQEEGVYLLCGKAPPYSPLPLTGRDILLRHATLLI